MSGLDAVLPGLLVAAGAAVGGPARHLLDTAVSRRTGRPLRGLLVVNLLGSLLAGVLTGLALDRPLARLLLVGLLGGFTTASGVAAQLAGTRASALLAVHLGGGALLAALGLVLGRLLG